MGTFLNKAKRALGSKTTYTKESEPPMSKAPKNPKLTWKKPKKRKVLKTYKDKGYKPSTGKGVGY